MPHQKELVERLKNQPFAILGINSDFKGDLEKINAMLQEQGVTWRQAIDGTTQGPIASRWNVSGWPTIYVLDAKGVIRFKGKGTRGKDLGVSVDTLLAEMGVKKEF